MVREAFSLPRRYDLNALPQMLNNLKAGDKKELSNQVHGRRMYRHSIHIWV
jgi:hypothetical protein